MRSRARGGFTEAGRVSHEQNGARGGKFTGG